MRRCPGAASQPAADGSAPVPRRRQPRLRPDPRLARPMKRLVAIAAARRRRRRRGRRLGRRARRRRSDYQVRAIFDNAGFVIPGEDVKIAGVKVGKIDRARRHRRLQGRGRARDRRSPGYQDFRSDAELLVRPQSLIGERFVECTPTAAAPPGASRRRAERDRGRPGRGPVPAPGREHGHAGRHRPDQQHHARLPAERLSLILNELGTGVAGRGKDLNEVIRRANPALKEIDQVLEILATQNEQLAHLAVDSDTILAPLARERDARGRLHRPGQQRGAEATAERARRPRGGHRELPRLPARAAADDDPPRRAADEMTPVLTDLGAQAPERSTASSPSSGRSRNALPAVESLGDAVEVGAPALEDARPIDRRPARLRHHRRPVADNLEAILDLGARHRRHRAADGLPLLPGGRDQRLRLESGTTCAPA